MANIDQNLVLILTACLYIVVFGGMSLLRREGLSVQFALEAAALSILIIGGSWLLGVSFSPILLLVILYLVTMRSRLIVDLANLFARRERYPAAFRLYRLGLAWWPDAQSRLIVLANRGAAELYSNQTDAAMRTLGQVLQPENQPRLGPRYEAGTRYNLGLAYERKGETARAAELFNEVVDLLPGSPFARAAQDAIDRRKKGAGG
jgi:tetratricopeptide (TPR) repeat protein